MPCPTCLLLVPAEAPHAAFADGGHPGRRPGPSKRDKRERTLARHGLTLLEVILTLGLMSLILFAIGQAIAIHLRMLDTRQTTVTEAQLARAVMKMIADDLRRSVEKNDFDQSELADLKAAVDAGVQSAITTAAAEAAEEAAAAGDAAGGTDAASGGAGGAGAGAGGGGSDPPADAPDSGDSETMDPDEEEEEIDYTADIASNTEPPPTPGIYGNQFQMQIDTARLPRVDELQMSSQMNLQFGAQTQDVASDVRTVAYFLGVGIDKTRMVGSSTMLNPLAGSQATRAGLMRRELSRAVMVGGGAAALDPLVAAGEVVAPEIASIEFAYYDGYQWLPTWDTEALQAVPVAVMVRLVIRRAGDAAAQPPGALPPASSAMPLGGNPLTGSPMTATEVQGGLLFQQVIPLPTAKPVNYEKLAREAEEEAAAEEGGETSAANMEALGI